MPRRKVFGWIALVLGVLLCGITINAGVDFANDAGRVRALATAGSQRYDAFESETVRTALSDLQPELQAAQRAINRLDLNWVTLLSAIEATHSPQVAMLALEPSASSRTVSISGEAVSADAATGFVATLAQQGVLSDVHLVQHQLVSSDPARPLRFTINARWKAATPAPE